MKLRSSWQSLLLATVASVRVAPCEAQSIQGVIVNESTHRPVGSARVAMLNDSGRVVASDTTRTEMSAFYLNAPHPGRYQLRIILGRGGVSFSPFFALDTNVTVDAPFAAPEFPTAILEAYLPDDVTTPAAYRTEAQDALRYPADPHATVRNGIVQARFVVDRTGQPDTSTFQIIQSDDPDFTRSVREALARIRFVPAERDGVAVPQVFEMGVDFGVAEAPIRLRGKNVIVVRGFPRH